jgi:hypothetical protein
LKVAETRVEGRKAEPEIPDPIMVVGFT